MIARAMVAAMEATTVALLLLMAGGRGLPTDGDLPIWAEWRLGSGRHELTGDGDGGDQGVDKVPVVPGVHDVEEALLICPPDTRHEAVVSRTSGPEGGYVDGSLGETVAHVVGEGLTHPSHLDRLLGLAQSVVIEGGDTGAAGWPGAQGPSQECSSFIRRNRLFLCRTIKGSKLCILSCLIFFSRVTDGIFRY